eukprot:CAMPEP_0183317542 /NCGR_PEP_ID=MMETSP0160_2-20130417/58203_1 /TAXON_ID=2839 ORGANISM="Odontella Sinensis, Strain Grunow 1884" /NCGR_SAMPLE_ID=MMETSP0160_2 /ASSEMBLY_ACC=CAM_ASM_000250 /LENGTH=76 /DNA_ID=CAMNT_0025483583 /DNA_START=252 /DNA_END=479 /DNA_ORIENTATION=-
MGTGKKCRGGIMRYQNSGGGTSAMSSPKGITFPLDESKIVTKLEALPEISFDTPILQWAQQTYPFAHFLEMQEGHA